MTLFADNTYSHSSALGSVTEIHDIKHIKVSLPYEVSNAKLASNTAKIYFFLAENGPVTLKMANGKTTLLNNADLVIACADTIGAILGFDETKNLQKNYKIQNDNASLSTHLNIISASVNTGALSKTIGLKQLTEPFILSPAHRAETPLIAAILKLITRHILPQSHQMPAALKRLLEILIVEIDAINDVSQTPNYENEQALLDQKIVKAISLIHADLNHPWTNEILAQSVGSPTELFTQRFSEITLIDPMSYIKKWRLQKSLQFLDQAASNLDSVALASGFNSKQSYNDAFSDSFGFTPDQYRKKRTH